MNKNSDPNFWNTLIQLMPHIEKRVNRTKKMVDSQAAQSLFEIWRNGESKNSSDRIYKRPITCSYADIKRMEHEGLIKHIEDDIEITSKGEEVIKVMILGDEKSIFEDNGYVIDYNEALSNINSVKTSHKKIASKENNWWDRFLK